MQSGLTDILGTITGYKFLLGIFSIHLELRESLGANLQARRKAGLQHVVPALGKEHLGRNVGSDPLRYRCLLIFKHRLHHHSLEEVFVRQPLIPVPRPMPHLSSLQNPAILPFTALSTVTLHRDVCMRDVHGHVTEGCVHE